MFYTKYYPSKNNINKLTIMKKILYFAVVLLGLASCTNQEEIQMDAPPTAKKSNFETFAIYGEVHNSLLQYMSTNFYEPEQTPTSKNEAVDYVLAIQREGIDQLSITESEKAILSEGLESYKRYYVTSDLMKTVQPGQSRDPFDDDDDEDLTTEDVRALIQEAYDTGSIDSFEYQSFTKLIDYVLANAAGSLSNADFEVKVNNLISQWEVKYADVDFTQLEIPRTVDNPTVVDGSSIAFKDTPKGALSGVVLNVSKSSLDYWDEEQILVQSRAVPAFVGADIAGAVIGACSAGTGSYVTTGSINWKSVAWGTASGAVISSTGIVGKVGKWISKFL
jgi:hypothetical protein